MFGRVMAALAATGILCALIAAPAGAATMTVKQAVLAQDKILNSQPGFKIVLNESKYKKSAFKTIAPKIAALKPVLNHAATVVAAVPAASAKEKQGQSDWVKGARIEGTAFTYLAKELIAVANGQTALAKQNQATGTKLFKQALGLARTGDKLLGLPANA